MSSYDEPPVSAEFVAVPKITSEGHAPSPTLSSKAQEARKNEYCIDLGERIASNSSYEDDNSNYSSTEGMPAGYPLKNIRQPHLHDVLCGRGGGTNNHAGNEKFRDLVNAQKIAYLNSSKREKPLVSRAIVSSVRNQTPPGRFLQRDEKDGLWYDIGDQKAREKTSQALREGAPVIRKEINMGAAQTAINIAYSVAAGHHDRKNDSPSEECHYSNQKRNGRSIGAQAVSSPISTHSQKEKQQPQDTADPNRDPATARTMDHELKRLRAATSPVTSMDYPAFGTRNNFNSLRAGGDLAPGQTSVNNLSPSGHYSSFDAKHMQSARMTDSSVPTDIATDQVAERRRSFLGSFRHVQTHQIIDRSPLCAGMALQQGMSAPYFDRGTSVSSIVGVKDKNSSMMMGTASQSHLQQQAAAYAASVERMNDMNIFCGEVPNTPMKLAAVHAAWQKMRNNQVPEADLPPSFGRALSSGPKDVLSSRPNIGSPDTLSFVERQASGVTQNFDDIEPPPPVTEDVRQRLALSELMTRCAARGKISPEILNANKEAALYLQAGLLGLDCDAMAEALARGDKLKSLIDNHVEKTLRPVNQGSCSASEYSNQDEPGNSYGHSCKRSINANDENASDAGSAKRSRPLDDPSRNGKLSAIRKRIESALCSIGAF